ncbi:MAG: hypothetical protein LBP75_07420 [Planctomycetota bacterium]|nr:hypothetical protein [Planctomycetota bacterium]
MKTSPATKAAPAPKKRRRREPKMFLIENGVWTEFVPPPIPPNAPLSPYGKWMRDHGPFKCDYMDMRAVLK